MFQHLTDTLTHPATLPVLGILLLVFLVFLTLKTVSDDTKLRTPKFSQNPMMNALGWAGVVLVLPGLIILIAAGWELFVLAWNYPNLDLDEAKIRRHGSLMLALLAAIGAIFTLVFAYIRVFTTERQTRATEEGLITDRINKSVEGLGAERKVDRIGRTVTVNQGDEMETYIEWQGSGPRHSEHPDRTGLGDWQVYSETLPNLEVRIGAIYALERIAQDSDRDHIQIMEILCAYIRQNTPLRETVKSPMEVWVEAPKARGRKPNRTDNEKWAESLSKPRIDIQVALQVLGRRKPHQIEIERATDNQLDDVMYRLNLAHCCLQAADLRFLNFCHADFSGAQMQGVRLHSTKIRNAGLRRTQMQAVNLSSAEAQNADFSLASLQGANLVKAQMQGASFVLTQLQGALLSGGHLQRVDFTWAKMQGADLSRAQMQGANLFGAEVQGAHLGRAQMQGAVLSLAQMDSATSLRGAVLSGALLREVDYTDVSISQAQIDELYYDGSVTFAKDITRSPGRKAVLGSRDFQKQYRAWQKENGFTSD